MQQECQGMLTDLQLSATPELLNRTNTPKISNLGLFSAQVNTSSSHMACEEQHAFIRFAIP